MESGSLMGGQVCMKILAGRQRPSKEALTKN